MGYIRPEKVIISPKNQISLIVEGKVWDLAIMEPFNLPSEDETDQILQVSAQNQARAYKSL